MVGIIITIVVLIYLVYTLCLKAEANHRVSPPGKQTDWTAMQYDRFMYGDNYANKKFTEGGYDITAQQFRDKYINKHK